MSEIDDLYRPPVVTPDDRIPSEIAEYLDGADLLSKTQAMRLSTVDEHGWPHASLLSAGDMLAVPPTHVRFLIAPDSVTTRNLVLDGRVTVTASFERGMWELRLRARRLHRPAADIPLACFEAAVERARFHSVPYAAVTSGITLELNDPGTVLRRWQRQIDALRAPVSTRLMEG